MLDLASPHFTTPARKQIMDFPATPRAALDAHLASLAAPNPTIPTIVSSDLTLTRFPLMLITVQHGLFPFFIPSSSPNLFPLERVARGDSLPKGGTLILHGRGDTMVPAEGSRLFVAAVEKKREEGQWQGGEVVLVERDGEHGFDTALGLDDGGDGKEAWLRRAWGSVMGEH